MSSKRELSYVTLDVFATKRYKGNPLAVIELPASITLTQEEKQAIAREFNISETVFVHPPHPDGSIPLDIFTPQQEIPFGGHPTVGTGIYLMSKLQTDKVVLNTKAGSIPVTTGQDGIGARLTVPTDFKIHDPFSIADLKRRQKKASSSAFVNGIESPEPVVSLVKGIQFLLLEVTSEDALASLHTFPRDQLELPPGHAGDWQGQFIGLFAYRRDDGVLRTRMFFEGVEDPATGAASSALAAYLGLTTAGKGVTDFHLVQGVEMGRDSEIRVRVHVGGADGSPTLEKVELEGTAVNVMKGILYVD